MSKQTSLGAFGFRKIVTKKDGKAELVDIFKVICEEKTLTCKFCRERLGNAGALSTHIKCKHSVVISQPGEPSSSSGKMKNIRHTYTLQRLKENQTKLLRTNVLSVKKAIDFTSASHI